MDKKENKRRDPEEESEELRVSLYNLSKEIERLYNGRTELMSFESACALADKFNVPHRLLVWFYA